MTLHQTIGLLANDIDDEEAAKAAVREVEAAFPDVKHIIGLMVQSRNPKTRRAEAQARDSAIVSQIQFNEDFAFALSERLTIFILTGE
jgi:hypothetical protein